MIRFFATALALALRTAVPTALSDRVLIPKQMFWGPSNIQLSNSDQSKKEGLSPASFWGTSNISIGNDTGLLKPFARSPERGHGSDGEGGMTDGNHTNTLHVTPKLMLDFCFFFDPCNTHTTHTHTRARS